MNPSPTPPDVRMKGFPRRTTLADALSLLDRRISPLSAEIIPLDESAGRVLAEPVASPVDVPAFPRAAMDGFALRAAETTEARDDLPVPFAVIGESRPGRAFDGVVGPGQAVRIMTGAPLPPGADAVLMAEFTLSQGDTVLARAAVGIGKNVAAVGEDVAKGAVVLPAGRRLRPQDVGLLAAIGVPRVAVTRRPRVALLVTGDELLRPGERPTDYRVVDSNSPMVQALLRRDGADCLPVCYVPDDPAAVREALRAASTADVILISGGTSVGAEDHVPRVVAESGELPVHGLALKPAGPAGIGFVPAAGHDGRPVPVFLLPGNPVACLCAYDLLAGRAVRRCGGLAAELPYRRVVLPLDVPLHSVAGRVDYARVRVVGERVVPLAVSGAANLSSAVVADGFVLVEADRTVLPAGEPVEVWLYDS